MSERGTWASVWLLLAVSLLACGTESPESVLAGGEHGTVFDRTSHAYSFPMPGLNAEELDHHALGDVSFESIFVIGPAPVNPGLGPAYNHNSCIQCHQRDGRGLVNFGPANSSALVRISLAGTPDANQSGIPVPGLGLQLQDHAVFGYQSEGRVELSWIDVPISYNDGTQVMLRKPSIALFDANDAPLNNVQTSLRVGPAVFGLGLLAAVPAEDIEASADPNDDDGDGISGRVNLVWDVERGQLMPGRFGLKANAPNLRQQAAGAYAEDMGVSNSLFPATDGHNELPDDTLDSTVFYLTSLAVPQHAKLSAGAKRGKALFSAMGCEGCHSPVLQTGPSDILALDRQTFAPYTDLLIHDMGEGLADGRGDFAATGSEWRTAPLWGLGLVRTVLLNANYLHDGRARSVEEAILWHGGEAAAAQGRFRAASKQDRNDLLEFLRHL